MLSWLHTFWQAAATIIALGALGLGWQRFRTLHLGRKGPFAWRRHVLWGSVALAAWIVGAILGITGARLAWGGFFFTGMHAWIGLLFVAIAVFGYLSGRILDKTRKRPAWLTPLHGACNLLLIILAFIQAWTGWPYLF